MANKKITDLELVAAFSETINVPVDTSIQTFRATGQQFLDFIKTKLLLTSVGADSDTTLTATSSRTQVVTPTADRTYDLPSTSLLASDTFTFINNAALGSGYDIIVKSSNGDTVAIVEPKRNVALTCIQATPTSSAHWIIRAPYNRIQRKYLSANTTTTPVTDLAFSNLTIGKYYRVSGQLRMNTNAGGDLYVEWYNSTNGTNRVGNLQRENNASVVGISVFTLAVNFVFRAVDTSLETRLNISGTVNLEGDGTTAHSFVQIEELNNYIETTAWT